MKSRLLAVFAFLALSLAACGGGGGSGGGTIPTAPQPGNSATPPAPTPTPVGATPTPSPKTTSTPVGSTPTPKPSPTATPVNTPTPVGSTPTPKPTPTGSTPTPKPTATPTAPPTQPPTAPPTQSPTPVPTHSPTPTPAPTHSPTPSPTQSYYPADPKSVITSTYGKIGLAQIFDYYPTDGTTIPASQAQADAGRYNFVWGSWDTAAGDPNGPGPQAWRSGNGSILASRYYIMEEDNLITSGHNLAWFQQNHPDWIMYACNSSGQITNDYAYTPGDGFADVPLNFENPAVVQYQVASLINYAQANGYTTIALDQVIFQNFMVGGNPYLGQTENTSEYACGTHNNDGSTTVDYSSKTDPKWTQDVLNWVAYAYQQAHAHGLSLAVNHPPASPNNANEQTVMSNADILLDEGGFSAYGTNGSPFTNAGVYNTAYAYMEAVEARGKAMVDIDRWNNDGQTPTNNHVEYGIATYEFANEGNLDLYQIGRISKGFGYGAESYFQAYQTVLGPPCTAVQSGGGAIYYRRFASGLTVANVGASSAQTYNLPSNHTYSDVFGRSVSSSLSINPEDGYVLVTSGNGCQ